MSSRDIKVILCWLVTILDSEDNIVEAMFRENTSTEDLFLAGQDYIDNLTNKGE